jgi:hypothetical protein
MEENPRQKRLEFLGIPWIPSSESGLFNGLQVKNQKILFRSPSLVSTAPSRTISIGEGGDTNMNSEFCKAIPRKTGFSD